MSREIIVRTGRGGAKMFHHAIAVTFNIQRANDLYDKKKITYSELCRLREMIKSKDNESFELALDLINIKEYE